MNFEKRIIDVVKAKGEMDGETPILHAPKNMFMRKSGRKWDLLYIGIYHTTSLNEEVPQFLMIEVDNQGNDTTNEQFFDWNELREELRVSIRSWIIDLEKK